MMSKRIIGRVGLPVSCLLVFMRAGEAGLPLGVGFFRFLNPRYSIESIDWLILGAFGAGLALVIASFWRAHRLLLVGAIGAFGAVIALAYHAWADAGGLALLLTAAPFVAFAVWSLLQGTRPRSCSV